MDLKLENILVCWKKGKLVVKVADFGVGQEFDQASGAHLAL